MVHPPHTVIDYILKSAIDDTPDLSSVVDISVIILLFSVDWPSNT